MEMVQGAEWGVIAIYVVGLLASLYLLISVQGDMRPEEHGPNSDDRAKDTFIQLIGKTNRLLIIHDDGNNFADSIYNNEEVISALRDRLRKKRKARVQCLFNYPDHQLKLLELARSDEFRQRIEIWYMAGDRPPDDIHYKIVDSGKMVHLSRHEAEATERGYRLRKAPWPWEIMTRHRIGKRWLDRFDRDLKNATKGV